jgi:hypothetical protein
MFQFRRFTTFHHTFSMIGCPIRTRTDQRSFATPRAFSQLTTSFVVSGSQGIPHSPLFRFHLFPTKATKDLVRCLILLGMLSLWLGILSYLFTMSFPVLSMNSCNQSLQNQTSAAFRPTLAPIEGRSLCQHTRSRTSTRPLPGAPIGLRDLPILSFGDAKVQTPKTSNQTFIAFFLKFFLAKYDKNLTPKINSPPKRAQRYTH